MKETRLSLLPDARITALSPGFREGLLSVAESVTPDNLGSILDESMRRVLELAFKQAGADEGAVWLVEESTKSLVPAYNNGPNASKLVGQFRQPLSAGLVSMVFSTQQPFMENDVWENSGLDKTLDTILHQQTNAMIAIPFYFLEACRGVVSCVQFALPESSPKRGFTERHEALIRHAAVVLGRLLDHKVLRTLVGLG